MYEDWEPCPRCKSNRVSNSKPGCIIFLVIILISSLFYIFNIVGLIVFIISLISLIVTVKSKKIDLSCKDCSYSWEKIR